MAQLPVFQTRSDARRFLLGFGMFLVGLVLWIATLPGGPSHAGDTSTFWLFNVGIGLNIIGGFIANGSLQRAFEATQSALRERTGMAKARGTRWKATKAIYSPSGIREAIRVARTPAAGNSPS